MECAEMPLPAEGQIDYCRELEIEFDQETGMTKEITPKASPNSIKS